MPLNPTGRLHLAHYLRGLTNGRNYTQRAYLGALADGVEQTGIPDGVSSEDLSPEAILNSLGPVLATMEREVVATLEQTDGPPGPGHQIEGFGCEPVRHVIPEDLPRCEELDGSSLRIVPAYTEAGRWCEAREITITDGVRTAVYAPIRTLSPMEHSPCPTPVSTAPITSSM